MFTIIEIILTVFAWRNGWKWRSLFPMIIGYSSAVLLGIFLAITRTANFADIKLYGLFLELGIILSLTMMILIPHDKNK